MQLMIDISQETAETLDLASGFLAQHATLKRAMALPTGFNTDAASHTHAAPVPTGTETAPPVPGNTSRPVGKAPELAADYTPPFTPYGQNLHEHIVTRVVPPPSAPIVPFGDGLVPNVHFPAPNPAAHFIPAPPPPVPANHPAILASNVVPFPPLAPVTAQAAPAAPNAAALPAVNTSMTMAQIAGVIELDTSGMPWDARIHSGKKGVNKDGTWRLLKNVDKALLAAVTQELHARMINSPPTAPSVPVGVQAPTFPGAMRVPQPPLGDAGLPTRTEPLPMPVPSIPAAGSVPSPFGRSPLPPGVEAASVSLPPAPSVPVPPVPVLGLPDAAHAGMVPPVPNGAEPLSDYRQFVARAIAARNDNRISPEQMASIVQQAGAPSIQLLGNMTHLLPKANFILDATLAGWGYQQIAEYITAAGM